MGAILHLQPQPMRFAVFACQPIGYLLMLLQILPQSNRIQPAGHVIGHFDFHYAKR
jgi:hypothetical protein